MLWLWLLVVIFCLYQVPLLLSGNVISIAVVVIFSLLSLATWTILKCCGPGSVREIGNYIKCNRYLYLIMLIPFIAVWHCEYTHPLLDSIDEQFVSYMYTPIDGFDSVDSEAVFLADNVHFVPLVFKEQIISVRRASEAISSYLSSTENLVNKSTDDIAVELLDLWDETVEYNHTRHIAAGVWIINYGLLVVLEICINIYRAKYKRIVFSQED